MTDARPVPVTQPSRRSCRVTDWRPHSGGGALLGKCTVVFGAMQISDVPVFTGVDGGLSVGTPSMPLVGPDGVQLRDDAGKRRYMQCIRFLTPEARQTWQASVLAALATAGIGANQQSSRGDIG